MRIVYFTLVLIVALNFGNPCDLGLRAEQDKDCQVLASGVVHCPPQASKPATEVDNAAR